MAELESSKLDIPSLIRDHDHERLRSLLKDEDSREDAVNALVQIGDAQARDALISEMMDSYAGHELIGLAFPKILDFNLTDNFERMVEIADRRSKKCEKCGYGSLSEFSGISWSLLEINSEAADDVLCYLLKHPSEMVRMATIKGMTFIFDYQARNVIDSWGSVDGRIRIPIDFMRDESGVKARRLAIFYREFLRNYDLLDEDTQLEVHYCRHHFSKNFGTDNYVEAPHPLIVELLIIRDNYLWHYRDRDKEDEWASPALLPEASYTQAAYGLNIVLKRVVEIGMELHEYEGIYSMRSAYKLFVKDEDNESGKALSEAWYGIGEWHIPNLIEYAEEVWVKLWGTYGTSSFTTDDVMQIGNTPHDANEVLVVLKDRGIMKTVGLRTFELTREPENK